MPTNSYMCDYCQCADRKAEPVETKAHGKIKLCERCKNHCQARGWLTPPPAQEAA